MARSFACLMLLLTTSCASTGVECAGWKPIYTADADVLTLETKREIAEHNRFWESRCANKR